MVEMIVSGGLKAIFWGLAADRLRSHWCLAALIACAGAPAAGAGVDLGDRKAVDLSTMPATRAVPGARRQRAGLSPLPGAGAGSRHRSPSSCTAHRDRARGAFTRWRCALAARGVETYAVDIRGHGASGTRGDIAYLGQLEDDMADLVGEIRKTDPDRAADADRPFVRRRLRAARRRLADPELVRAHRAAGALSRLRRAEQPPEFRRLGQRRYSAFPRVAGAAPPRASAAANRCRRSRSRCRRIRAKVLTPTYSYRLMRNFAASQTIATISRPRPGRVTIFSRAPLTN